MFTRVLRQTRQQLEELFAPGFVMKRDQQTIV